MVGDDGGRIELADTTIAGGVDMVVSAWGHVHHVAGDL